MHVVVVGAGVFGSWTALWLRRRGASVTLVEQYAPANSLSSSGDETRVTRSAHGPDEHYPRWQRRALAEWRRLDPALFVPTGVAWFVRAGAAAFEDASLATLERLRIPVERLDTPELARHWPQIEGAGIDWVLHEPEAGVLLARRAVAATVDRFVAEGGLLRIGQARVAEGALLVDGEPLEADATVMAAGSWLPTLLGAAAGVELSVTRQEVVYFATPPGDHRFDAVAHPTWVEYDAAFYGLPSIEGRGFKVAPDWPGPIVDPDRQDRRLTDAALDAARGYLRRRFPALGDQPVGEGRVCQYELTADTHFIIDRHPRMSRTWVVGGGSGHGFKHGPAVGEYVSALVVGDGAAAAELAPPDGRFALRPRAPGMGMRTSGQSSAESASTKSS